MPIDTSIYGNIQQFKAPDPFEAQAKAASLANTALQGAVLQKQLSAKDYEQQAKALEFHINQAGAIANLAMGAKDQESYEKALALAQNQNLDTSMLPKDFDPAVVRAIASNALQQKDRLAAEKQKYELPEIQSRTAKNYADIGKINNDISNSGQEKASKLRQEYMGNQTLKDTQHVAVAYNKMQRAAEEPSAAGDLSLIFGYMKMLDPGSTVREGEQASAAQAAGVPSQLLNLYNRVITGEKLSPEQRADFMNQGKKIYEGQLSQKNKLEKDYERLAIKAKINPDDVLLNVNADQSAPQEQRMAGSLIPSANAGEQKPKTIKPDLKEINGKRYTKVKGGWEELK